MKNVLFVLSLVSLLPNIANASCKCVAGTVRECGSRPCAWMENVQTGPALKFSNGIWQLS